MKTVEIKEMVEKVIRTEYVAEDGTKFYTEEECKKYEDSAVFAIKKRLKRISKDGITHCDFNECDDSDIEIFDIQTDEDLKALRMYLYATAKDNGASDKAINGAFTDIDGKRSDFVFDNVTTGHEVIIFWSYDKDWFWVIKDGSFRGYCEWLKERYNKLLK